MSNRFHAENLFVLGISLSFTFTSGSYVYTQTPSRVPGPVQKEATMPTRASGTFEIRVTPQMPGDKSAGMAIGRMSIDKQFQGDLKGTSKGEMLPSAPTSRTQPVTSQWSRSTEHSMDTPALSHFSTVAP